MTPRGACARTAVKPHDVRACTCARNCQLLRTRVSANEGDLLAAELHPIAAIDDGRRSVTSRPFAVDLDHSRAPEIGACAVGHLDAPDVTPLAAQIDRQFLALANGFLDGKLLAVTIEINEADADHVDVIAISDKMKGPIAPFPIPILALAEADDVAIDEKTNALLAKQFPAALPPARFIISIAATVAIEAAVAITVAPLCIGIRRRYSGE